MDDLIIDILELVNDVPFGCPDDDLSETQPDTYLKLRELLEPIIDNTIGMEYIKSQTGFNYYGKLIYPDPVDEDDVYVEIDEDEFDNLPATVQPMIVFTVITPKGEIIFD